MAWSGRGEYRQTTEDFIACLENAFAAFGGVVRTLVIDNLRAAVKHPDWFDPELVPRLEAFCRHYDVVILPATATALKLTRIVWRVCTDQRDYLPKAPPALTRS